MFTGIVEELGEVLAIEQMADSARLTIAGQVVTQDVGHGDSISVNGVCLTVTDFAEGHFSVDVMAETLDRSSVGALTVASSVNLERALRSDGRFGGHVVQGHIDATTTLLAREPGERWEVLTFALGRDIARYVVSKGSITLDGVSLTISDVSEIDQAPEGSRDGDEIGEVRDGSGEVRNGSGDVGRAEARGGGADEATFSVSLIPTTLAMTTLGTRQIGDAVNVEVDVLAKYVERLMGVRGNE
ncbi:riboflavin synthase [soil metagenome]